MGVDGYYMDMRRTSKRKKMMTCNRAVAVLLTAVLILGVLSLCGCSGRSFGEAALRIVCTNFVGYDFARAILGGAGYDLTGGGKTTVGNATGDTSVEIILLSKQGQDLHGFEPSAADIAQIATADLFIYVGGESEKWVKSALAAADNPDLVTVCMMESSETLLKEEEHGDREESEHGTEVEYDEHVWTSIGNAYMIVNDIDAALMKIIEEKELAFDWEVIRKSTIRYMSELSTWDDMYKNLRTDAARSTVVIADRYPFAYLMRDMGLTCYAAFPGCSSETQASFSTQVMLVEKVKEYGIPFIFTVDNSAGSVAETVAGQTGAGILRLWSGQIIPGEGDPQTYLEMLEANYNNLKMALN